MIAIILAAGYATRLYPLTENQPKPLLNIGDKPLVEHLTDKIQKIEEIKKIFIVTNHKFYPHFETWLRNYPCKKKIKIINDGTLRNEDRLGAIGDLFFVLKEENIKEDVLMIAGDNLFGFSLKRFISFFEKKNQTALAFCDLKEKNKVANKFGVGLLDKEKKVINFEEKPSSPKSTLAATCCYLISKKDLNKIAEYIQENRSQDNPGDFIKWLIKRQSVYGFIFSGYWFDIGSFEGLEEASSFYERRLKKKYKKHKKTKIRKGVFK